MKNVFKLFGIIALAAVIGFIMFACKGAGAGGGGGGSSNGGSTGTGGGGTGTPGGGGWSEDTGTPQPSTPGDGGGGISHIHEWGIWSVTIDATCTTEGVETRTCILDDTHKETNRIPKDSNAHNWEQLAGVASTCIQAGYGTRKCRLCSITETADILPIDPYAHDWMAWIIKNPAACTTVGEETRTCKHDSSHNDTRTLAALGHNWGSWVSTATFITEGEETRTCRHDPSHTESYAVSSRPITNLTEWNTALAQLNAKTGNYVLNINAAGYLAINKDTSFGETPSGSLNVTLKGGSMTVTNSSNVGGTMLRIGRNQKLIIDGITLTGRTTKDDTVISCTDGGAVELRRGEIRGGKNGCGVSVGSSGTFTMYGGKITSYTGIGVRNGGTFTMNGGEISGNSEGVSNSSSGIFIMNDGKISSNNNLANINSAMDTKNPSVPSSASGVGNLGTFTMNGGEISGNSAVSINSTTSGGGVYNKGTFTMYGGKIYNNRVTIDTSYSRTNSRTQGGGVYNYSGTFTMYGGEIYGNTANVYYDTDTFSYGGGVYNEGPGGIFNIVTGIIYGSNDPDKANLASNGGALYRNATSQYGNGSGIWTSLSSTDTTIKVVNGVKY